MVADMITAHDRYMEDHHRMFTTENPDEFSALTISVVESYLDNRLMWDELHHFQKHNRILGNHQMFQWYQRRSEITGMRIADLVKLKTRLENNLVRNRAALRRQPDHTRNHERRERIAMMEKELIEVNRMLSIL